MPVSLQSQPPTDPCLKPKNTFSSVDKSEYKTSSSSLTKWISSSKKKSSTSLNKNSNNYSQSMTTIPPKQSSSEDQPSHIFKIPTLKSESKKQPRYSKPWMKIYQILKDPSINLLLCVQKTPITSREEEPLPAELSNKEDVKSEMKSISSDMAKNSDPQSPESKLSIKPLTTARPETTVVSWFED